MVEHDQKRQRSRGEIACELEAAIKRCVFASGRAMPSLRADQCPLTVIQGFDSLCGIEVTVDLQERLKLQLADNIFVKTNRGQPRARTFDEIVDALVSIAK